MDPDIHVYFIDGNNCASVYLNRGQFFQQCAPSANPLYSPEETGFMQSACGLLWLYGETKLARVADLILQLPLPNEALVASLLSWDALDKKFKYSKTKFNSHKTMFRLVWHLKTKQDEFYHKYGDADIIPPPYVPRTLFQFTNAIKGLTL
ncbi:hypothetical protein OG21DRAFT_1525616 [Imleria badia]|nr:hypothetical protein OG21DRAFT_1525616 [Imleria badia]